MKKLFLVLNKEMQTTHDKEHHTLEKNHLRMTTIKPHAIKLTGFKDKQVFLASQKKKVTYNRKKK